MTLETSSRPCSTASTTSQMPKRRAGSAGSHIMSRTLRGSRLQGIAPCESPPHRIDCLGRTEHVALLGIRPSRVLSLARMGPTFVAPPLMRLPPGQQVNPTTLYRVLLPTRLAGL
jgi:hypothetical protein